MRAFVCEGMCMSHVSFAKLRLANMCQENLQEFLRPPLWTPRRIQKKLSFLAFLRGLLGSLSRTGDDVDRIATHGGLYLLNTETTLARNSLPRACRKAVMQRHRDKTCSSWRASYYANLLCSLGFLGLKKIVLPGIMPAM